jgi:uncharacterized damage-inducible protein DinB
MSRSLLADAFEHHTWATLRLIDACQDLSAAQLETHVPGTYGSIVQTLRHIVAGDAFDLFVLDGNRNALAGDEASMGLSELRAAMERYGRAWATLLAGRLDPDAMVEEIDPDDGYRRWAPIGIRLAAALNHATEHRTQVWQ